MITQNLARAALLVSACALAACQSGAPDQQVQTFDAISEGEIVRVIGTEPFWGGDVTGGSFTYSTPENIEGERIAVDRFAGNSGLGFSGMRGGEQVDLLITQGECSDGMSDRRYPFTATLRIGAETRNGCAWTAARPYSGTATP